MKYAPLLIWNALCVIVPTILYLQPSPEPSIANAVITVIVVGPAAAVALAANLIACWRLGATFVTIALTVLSASIFAVWGAAVLAA